MIQEFSLSKRVCSTILTVDEVIEEAIAFRERYCKSIVFAATNSNKGLLRLATVSPSKFISKMIYHTLPSIDSQRDSAAVIRRDTFLLTAASIALLLAARWLCDRTENDANAIADFDTSRPSLLGG